MGHVPTPESRGVPHRTGTRARASTQETKTKRKAPKQQQKHTKKTTRSLFKALVMLSFSPPRSRPWPRPRRAAAHYNTRKGVDEGIKKGDQKIPLPSQPPHTPPPPSSGRASRESGGQGRTRGGYHGNPAPSAAPCRPCTRTAPSQLQTAARCCARLTSWPSSRSAPS